LPEPNVSFLLGSFAIDMKSAKFRPDQQHCRHFHDPANCDEILLRTVLQLLVETRRRRVRRISSNQDGVTIWVRLSNGTRRQCSVLPRLGLDDHHLS
jgi:hypothetical protein